MSDPTPAYSDWRSLMDRFARERMEDEIAALAWLADPRPIEITFTDDGRILFTREEDA